MVCKYLSFAVHAKAKQAPKIRVLLLVLIFAKQTLSLYKFEIDFDFIQCNEDHRNGKLLKKNYRSYFFFQFQNIFLIALITTNLAFGSTSVVFTKSENLATQPNSTQPGTSQEQVFYGFSPNYPWGVSYIPVQYVPQQQPPKVHTTGPKSEFELVNTKPGSNLNNRFSLYPGFQNVYV